MIASTDPDIENSCVQQEYNPVWVKWSALESGTITFILTPDSVDQDLDFIVFRSEGDYDCINKTQIRCMAAGANSGEPPHEWARCAGATGLSIGETDILAPPGCLFITSNNFLAPIEALAGEHYMMLINDFAESGYGYSLSFGGTAVLDCITVSTYPGNEKSQLAIALNPTLSTGIIYINAVSEKIIQPVLTIFNTGGQIVYSQELVETHSQVDLNHLHPGVYYAVLKTRDSYETKMFLITR